MQNDKIDEISLRGDESSYVDAVERFLHRRIIHQRISVFLIGDDRDYGQKLTSGVETAGNIKVIGRSHSAMEQVMVQLNQCTPDIILFDVGFGLSNHLRTTQLVRGIAQQAKMLAIMPDELPLHIQQARWCGFDGWILKEQPLQELVTKITALYECQPGMKIPSS